MILSDKSLKQFLSDKTLVIDPLDESQIQPASIDCTLGTHFLTVATNHMDCIRMDAEIKYEEIVAEHITIPANSFLLATTSEYIEVPNHLTAFVEGRSSVGRMGLFIQNAGWVDAGFKGRITLELYNANQLPIKLFSGRRICQLVFCEMDQAAEKPYRGKYYGQKQSVGSRIFLDKDLQKTS